MVEVQMNTVKYRPRRAILVIIQAVVALFVFLAYLPLSGTWTFTPIAAGYLSNRTVKLAQGPLTIQCLKCVHFATVHPDRDNRSTVQIGELSQEAPVP